MSTPAGSGMRLPTGESLMAPALTDDEVQRARVAVCANASDAQDAALLLDMLGIGADA